MTGVGIGVCVGFFVLLFLREAGAMCLGAWRGGWSRLGDRYADRPKRPGRGVECRVRVGDRWCPAPVVVAASAAGVRLSVRALLARPFYRPVLVPWDDVAFVRDDWSGGPDLPLRLGDTAFVRLTGPAVPLVASHLNRQAGRIRRGR